MTWSLPSTRGMSNIKTFFIGHSLMDAGCGMKYSLARLEERAKGCGITAASVGGHVLMVFPHAAS